MKLLTLLVLLAQATNPEEMQRRNLLEAAVVADPTSADAFHQLLLHCQAIKDIKCAESAERSYQHLKAPSPNLRVCMDPPVLLVESPAEERRWGRYQFPTLDRLDDGRLLATIHVEADSATAYGAPKLNLVSSDNGRTWRKDDSAISHGYGIRLKNGDYLRTDTPPALDISALTLPSPVGEFKSYNVPYNVYALSQLPRDLRLIFFQRFHKGQWRQESSELDDSTGLRYTVQGRFPRIWWGDMLKARDGSLLALTYPRIAAEPPYRFGSAAYRSTNNGATWKMQGQIPNGDLPGSGFTEPALAMLPNGTLYAALRTTDGSGVLPMFESRSSDLGRTWSTPKVIAPNGVLPRFLRLDNGVLVLSSGRPGVQLRFSPSGLANDWSKPWELIPTRSSRAESDTCSYTNLVALDRDSFLIVYSWFHKPDSEGRPRKAVFARRVRVTKTISGKQP